MHRNDIKNKKALSARQVAAIYTDRIRSQYEIAEQYGISQSLVSRLRASKRWKSLTADLPLYHRENFRHARSGRRKLTQPAQIKDIFCSGLSKEDLAAAYGLHIRTIERIQKGELHKNVTKHLS